MSSDFIFIRVRNTLLKLCPWMEGLLEARQLLKAGSAWRRQGWTVPVPYFIRRAQLIAEGQKISACTFVETGTFRGDTSHAMSRHFSEVHTIEIQPDLAEMARRRFAGSERVHVHEGESGVVLKSIVDGLKGPTLFYLDGHHSGGFTGKGDKVCPALEELDLILTSISVPFTIVIDDARLFGTEDGYPSIDEVRNQLGDFGGLLDVAMENDALTITRN